MDTKRKSGNVTLFALLVGFVSVSIIAIIVIVETAIGNSTLDDSIIIDKPVSEVFSAIIDPDNIDKISQNIAQVHLKTKGPLAKESAYERILFSHGIPNFQVVTIEEFEQDKTLTTKTTLVGFDVTYRYVLTPTPDGRTSLSLKKDGQGGWLILKPLLIHLLTRLEHDGDHLMRIKRLVESLP